MYVCQYINMRKRGCLQVIQILEENYLGYPIGTPALKFNKYI